MDLRAISENVCGIEIDKYPSNFCSSQKSSELCLWGMRAYLSWVGNSCEKQRFHKYLEGVNMKSGTGTCAWGGGGAHGCGRNFRL